MILQSIKYMHQNEFIVNTSFLLVNFRNYHKLLYRYQLFCISQTNDVYFIVHRVEIKYLFGIKLS